jgi:hypothetical protein
LLGGACWGHVGRPVDMNESRRIVKWPGGLRK